MKTFKQFLYICWMFYWFDFTCSSTIHSVTPAVRSVEHVLLGYTNIRLRCKADGDPKPKIHWYRHYVDGSIVSLKVDTRFKIEKTYLRITRIEPWDEGSYSCVVWNQSGLIYRNFTIIIDDVESLWEEFFKREIISANDLNEIKSKRILLMNSLQQSSSVQRSKSEPNQINCTNETATNVVSGSDVALKNITDGIHSMGSHVYVIIFAALSFVLIFIAVLSMRYCTNFHRFNWKTFCSKTSSASLCRLRAYRRRPLTVAPALESPKVTITRVREKNLNLNFRTDTDFDFDYLESISSNPKWEIERTNLILSDASLGEGEFGRVYCGQLRTPHGFAEYQTVAVKTLKIGECTNREFVALISELKMLQTIGRHPNIVNLIGHCTSNGPIYVVYEHCALGNLRNFLRQHRPRENYHSTDQLTVYGLVRFAYQVARGMKFLASKNCVHRDLAARNVFVTEEKILKIGDFGLARDIESTQYYRRKSDNFLPFRWLAPESLLSKTFTIESDVWSFGVLFWEIMTLGGKPYSLIPADCMYDCLSEGYRLVKPHGCPEEVYCVMWNCWNIDPKLRWSFTRIESYLDELLMASSSKHYVTVVRVHNLDDHSVSSVDMDDIDGDDKKEVV